MDESRPAVRLSAYILTVLYAEAVLTCAENYYMCALILLKMFMLPYIKDSI